MIKKVNVCSFGVAVKTRAASSPFTFTRIFVIPLIRETMIGVNKIIIKILKTLNLDRMRLKNYCIFKKINPDTENV